VAIEFLCTTMLVGTSIILYSTIGKEEVINGEKEWIRDFSLIGLVLGALQIVAVYGALRISGAYFCPSVVLSKMIVTRKEFKSGIFIILA